MRLSSIILLSSRIIKPRSGSPSNARKSLIGAVLCIALSLIPLVVVLVVSDGMIEGITGRIIGLSSFHVQVAQIRSFSNSEQNMSLLEEIQEEVLTFPTVTNAFIEHQGTVLAAGPKGRSGAAVRAVNERLFSESDAFKKYVSVIDGVAAFPKRNSAVIGKKIASTLGLSVGDTIRLISARTANDGTVIPRIMSYTVSGIVSSGYQEIDALWVFIPLENGFSFLNSAASQIYIGIETIDAFSSSLDNLVYDIAEILPVGFDVYAWSELNQAQYENFASTRIMLLFVMLLIVLVASVNISAALVMIVMERRKEIAILKSIGASSSGITLSYVITGGVSGAAGVLIGIPLGLVCAVNVNVIMEFLERVVNVFGKILYIISAGDEYVPISLLDPSFYLETIPVVIPFFELFVIGMGTILLSVIVSVLPAIRAGREKPLHILKKV